MAGLGNVQLTPWGETWDALAQAIVDDPTVPDVLLLAALGWRSHRSPRLQELVAAAVALHERELAAGQHG